MFSNIKIQNFRGIKSLEIKKFKQINVFVGNNNSGKTTLLEALFLLTAPTNPELIRTINLIRGIDLSDENIWDTYFTNTDNRNNISIKGKEIRNNQNRELIISPHSSTNIKTTLPSETLEIDISNANSSIPNISAATNGLILDCLIDQKRYSTSIQLNKNRLHINPDNNYSENLRGIFVSPNAKFAHMATQFNNILIKKEKKKIISILKEIEPSIVDISLGSRQTIYIDSGFDQLIPINLLGDGVLKMFSIILSISDAKNGHVFIDEIENGFHYSTLKILWRTLLVAAKEYNVQIFITTHSFECIKAFSDTYNQETINKESFNLFRIEKKIDRTKVVDYSPSILLSSILNDLEIR